MLTKERISRFYIDLAALGLKRPVATIVKKTGISKGNVSEVLSKKKEPSENFLNKFYESFPLANKDIISDPGEHYSPSGNAVKNYGEGLLKGNADVTVQDYIKELRDDKKKLQHTIDINLTAMMQLLSALSRHDRAFHETILRSLSRIEGGNVDLVLEAHSSEAAKMIEEAKAGSNVSVDK